MEVSVKNESVQKKERIQVLDFIRALAIVHVFLFHYCMEWFGSSFMSVPGGVTANLSRWELFKGGDWLALLKNLVSFLWFYGFSAVNAFIVVSGFVLTYGMLQRPIPAGGGVRGLAAFYYRKFKRIIEPFYVSVVFGIAILYLRNLLFPGQAADPIYGLIDGLKLVFVPFLTFDMVLLQKFNGDYWFVPLILQLYLLFPLLFFVLKKVKPVMFIAGALVVTLGYRFIAAYFLDTVPIGVIWPSGNSYLLFVFFLPRLAEFCFGMVLGWAYFHKKDVFGYLGRGRFMLLGALLAYGGFILRSYCEGWIFCDLFMGIGVFLFLLNLARYLERISFMERFMKSLGGCSYQVYLAHHYVLNYLLLPLIFALGLRGNESVYWALVVPYGVMAIWSGRFILYVEKSIGKIWAKGLLLKKGRPPTEDV